MKITLFVLGLTAAFLALVIQSEAAPLKSADGKVMSEYGCIHYPTGGSWCGDLDGGPMPPKQK